MYHDGIAFLLNLLQARKNINTAESKTNFFRAVWLYKYLFKNSLLVHTWFMEHDIYPTKV